MPILVIDVGTSSMRATLFDGGGIVLHRCRSTYSPVFLDAGRVEQDPTTWSDSLINLTRSICQWAVEHQLAIEAISLTAQRSSAIPLDASGKPLCQAIMWQDTRAGRLCSKLSSGSAEIYARTGLCLSPVLAAPKFAWFKSEQPQIYKAAYKLVTVADYLVHVMSGLFVTDATYGSRTLLMNLRGLEWDAELLRIFDLDEEKLCTLMTQGGVVGRTSQAFAKSTTLPVGTPIVSAGGDQQCGALGAGIFQSGSVLVTTGTGSYVLAASNCLHLDPEMKIMCSVSAVPGQFILEASIPATSAVWAWAGRTLYEGGCETAEMLRKLGADASSSPAGAGDVLLLPHFQGRGSPDWNPGARGLFANVSLSTTRGDLVRAVLEGIAAEIAENVENILQHIEGKPSLLAAGGLSNLALFNQIQADMTGLDVCVPENRETTSQGAWVSAAVAMGIYSSHADALAAAIESASHTVFHPEPANKSIYTRLRAERSSMYAALHQAGMLKIRA